VGSILYIWAFCSSKMHIPLFLHFRIFKKLYIIIPR
jgi:hypothetical protein